MAWKITRDHLDGGTDTDRKGTGFGTLDGPTVTFHLRDDDGYLYYSGQCDRAGMELDDDADGSLYHALRWGMYDAGATDLLVRLDTLAGVGMDPTRETPSRRYPGWAFVYG